jgi:hypothetical protein
MRRRLQPTNWLRRGAQLALFCLSFSLLAFAQEIRGRVSDPQGRAVQGASVHVLNGASVLGRTTSEQDGSFQVKISQTGTAETNAAEDEAELGRRLTLRVEADSFETATLPLTAQANGRAKVDVPMRVSARAESVIVTADLNDLDLLSPDPGQKVFVRDDLLDANPGRPGAPVSIPGYPIETASSGIKAPQYFAPGVAGDHGEPIAQFIAVGSYLVPNNLSANAHGNGYADPNLFVPAALESVKVDGGAFNVRQGNHAVNLATIYGLREQMVPFVSLTGDLRDLDVVAGFSPSRQSLLALEASYGDGFLERLEHRQQYKLNGQRIFALAAHNLTLLGIAYYGFSYLPGLVPISKNANDSNFPNYGDTIDLRQKDRTYTALVAANDLWRVSAQQQLQLSSFFRVYNLSLFSDFGQGLIRQSEFRTVAGGSTNYIHKLNEAVSVLGGFDYEREAPRHDDLDRYGLPDSAHPRDYGVSTKVDSNNITIASFTPYMAAAGQLTHRFRYYAGWRRDQINTDNEDLLHTENSFQKWAGVNSPKASLSFLPKQSWFFPLLSLSFGQAFFTEDPRIATGTARGFPVATAHSYQLVASKTIASTDVKLTLGHVTTSQQLAKLDPDTGLQENQGPGRLRFATVSVRKNFRQSSFLATFSKADARDLDTGDPTPEAPRTIFDLLGSTQKLPFGLQAQGEFEYVGRKPLGVGCEPHLDAQCVGTPVREFRAAVVRGFLHNRLNAGVNMLIARGYAGQTIENFYPSEIQEVVGVRIPSYASVHFTYRFGRTLDH